MNDANPLHLTGAELDHPRHVCAFFNSEDEEYNVLLPFIKDGFVRGHKAVHVVSHQRHDRHINELRSVGIDAAEAERLGQLDLRFATEVYLDGGRFDQDRMLQAFEHIAACRERAFPANRIVCQMDWASHHPSCIHDVIEFEARVNHLWSRYNDTVVCVYDLAKFSSETILDVMRTHPIIIVGGTIQKNPFFVPPDQFLRDLRDRAFRQLSSQARTS